MLGIKIAPVSTSPALSSTMSAVGVEDPGAHGLASSTVTMGTPRGQQRMTLEEGHALNSSCGAGYIRHSTPKEPRALPSRGSTQARTPAGLPPPGSAVTGHLELSPVGVLTPHPAGQPSNETPPPVQTPGVKDMEVISPVTADQTVLLPWLVSTGLGLQEEGGPSDLDYPGEVSSSSQGSDPLMQTARGKLQTQRSKLNDQINRELRLRAGAENLFKATTNKKLRETVALELSYVNSNLQLLKEELADLNSSVLIYQNDSAINCVPMLPLGLKETKEVEFKSNFKDYICSHYHDDGESYDAELQALNDIRQACRTPVRNETGIQLLYEYYNHLYFVEKRFFPPDKSIGLYFEWYDSLTGVPSSQRTVGFEKGSTLFNIAALYTQIGARQDRTKLDGVDKAVDCFQRAAGAFQYLQDNFSHAPSMDLQPPTLTMLIQLMLSQAQECIMERAMLEKPPSNIQGYLQAAQEAAKVAEMYAMSHGVMQEEPIKEYVPPSWVSMAEVKSQYFTSLAHHHTATAIIDLQDQDVSDLRQQFEKVHIEMNGTPSHSTSTAIETFCDRKTLAKAHLRQSILCLEEAMSIHSQSKQLRRIDTFQDILRAAHDELLVQFAALEEEDDFSELMSAPPIRPHSSHSVNSIQPDFGKYKVDDLMRRLGLLAIFSARHSWTAPRELLLRREVGQDYGFSVRGDSPVIIAMVENGSLAYKAGMKVGDFLVAVEERDVKWFKHDEVVQLIRLAGLTLRLRVVSPIDRNYLDPGQGPSSSRSSGSGGSPSQMRSEAAEREMGLKPAAKKEEKSGSAWTLRRKGGSKEKQSKVMTNGDR